MILQDNPARLNDIGVFRHRNGHVGILFHQKDRVAILLQLNHGVLHEIDQDGKPGRGRARRKKPSWVDIRAVRWPVCVLLSSAEGSAI